MNCSGKLLVRKQGIGALLGTDPGIERVRKLVEQVAPTAVSVLISGEAGTGKGLVAAAIHAHSPRADRHFVRVHCANHDEASLESELFGHDAGARREGRLEQADGGTLYLGEVSEMPPGTQAKLLRFLEERGFERVGGRETLHADIRVIAATHRDLREEVASGRFREDLYYRLGVVQIELPPLRERRGDILPLAKALLAQLAEEHGRSVEGFAPQALERILAYPWPGNVRELENAIERAVVMTSERWIRPEHLESVLGPRPAGSVAPLIPGSTLAEIERVAILRTLDAVGGSTSRAAAMLGISTRKIQYRMREYREVGLVGGPSTQPRGAQ